MPDQDPSSELESEIAEPSLYFAVIYMHMYYSAFHL